MLEEKLWEREWFEISFKNSGLNTKYFNLPSSTFYQDFYEILFRKYSSWDQLPKKWLDEKKFISLEIIKLLPPNAKVLSFGTGLGFIENIILENRKDIKLQCFDTSKLPSRWLIKKYKNLKYETDIEKLENYDFIFFSQVLYAMPKNLILKIFKKVYTLINPHGKILLIDSPPTYKSFKHSIIKFIKIIYNFILRYDQYQFWGWLREAKLTEKYLESCGLILISKSFLANQDFQIYTKY